MRRISAPKSLEPRDIHYLLERVQYFFEERTDEPNFRLDLSDVQKTHFLGFLIIYKLIEYSFINKRFLLPQLETDPREYVKNEMIKYGFWNLTTKFFDKKNAADEFKKLPIVRENNFFLAPQALLREEEYTKDSLQKKMLPSISSYYADEKASDMIFHCISEIITNFWEHAVSDTQSIIVARGNLDNVEIACADTAKGIISTLRPFYTKLSDDKILSKSLEKGVTSKRNTDHMGHGLWFLSKITSLVNGRMHIYSEGYMHRNDFGNVRVNRCGYWKGTIIYVSLPVKNPIRLSDIPEFKDIRRFARLKINFL